MSLTKQSQQQNAAISLYNEIKWNCLLRVPDFSLMTTRNLDPRSKLRNKFKTMEHIQELADIEPSENAILKTFYFTLLRIMLGRAHSDLCSRLSGNRLANLVASRQCFSAKNLVCWMPLLFATRANAFSTSPG